MAASTRQAQPQMHIFKADESLPSSDPETSTHAVELMLGGTKGLLEFGSLMSSKDAVLKDSSTACGATGGVETLGMVSSGRRLGHSGYAHDGDT